MITIKTLDQATAQEVFDHVANHLLTQNKQSKNDNEGKCLYRGNDGLKCAAGCLIADDEYDPIMDSSEQSGWRILVRKSIIPSTKHDNLIIKLQIVHDSCEPICWKDELINVARENGLSSDLIINF